MGSVIVRTAANILSLLDAKVNKAGDTMSGILTLENAKVRAGTWTDTLGSALEVVRNGVQVGRIDNNSSGLRVQAQSGTLQLRGSGNTGMSVASDGKVNFDVNPTIAGSPLGGQGHMMAKNKFLPGRPIHTSQKLVQIAAFAAWVSIFRVSETRLAPGISYSISTAAAAGSKARIGLFSWDWDTMQATLRDDYGEINIDATGNFTAAKPVGMTDLSPGDYAAIIIPQAAVTLRMLEVHDLIYGAQSANGLFDPNADRANPAFVAVQGSYPAAIPATLVFTTAYTHVGAKAAMTWMVLS